MWQAILIEALFTFVLCMVVLVVMTSNKLKGNSVYGLAIGLTLTAIAFAGGPISGGVFNPAVGAGPILFDVINGGKSLPNLTIYLSGPFLGGLVAAIIYKLTNND